MSRRTTIEWTQGADGADGATWNPVVGCAKVSEGCDHCYAVRHGARIQRFPAYAGTVAGGDWTGLVRCLPERLPLPQTWKTPLRIFVNSMSDLWHPDVPDAFIGSVFAAMALAPWHTFMVLSKRPQAMARWANRVAVSDRGWRTHNGDTPASCGGTGVVIPEVHGDGPGEAGLWPLPHVWLGTTIESDRYAWRADHLRATPAAVRFLSLEPLLGPLPSLDLTGIDMVIVGGESGPQARPMDPRWARDLRDRALAAGAAFFFKQWGAWVPADHLPSGRPDDATTRYCTIGDPPVPMIRTSRRAGVHDPKQLDGVAWHQHPTADRR